MINILIGAGLCLLFFLCLAGAFYGGYKLSKPKHGPKITPEEKRQAEQRQKEFSEMMNYNMDKAVRRRRTG